MLLPDVNILVNAFREAAPDHARCRHWLQNLVDGAEPFGMSELVLSAFVRVVTNPRIFRPPDTIDDALEFVDAVRRQPNCVVISPGLRHWEIFVALCRASAARGNLVPDAYLAALAIESGSEWVSGDGDFGRFPGLRWRRPF